MKSTDLLIKLAELRSTTCRVLEQLIKARRGRTIGGDVCLGTDECDQLIEKVSELDVELNKLLDKSDDQGV